MYLSADDPVALTWLGIWMPMLGQVPNRMNTYWNMRDVWYDVPRRQCFYNDGGLFAGVSTTNAIAYSSGPPVFSKGTLDYQVGATHFNSDDQILKGTYNILMRTDVARCIYSLKAGPIIGSVSITDDSGKANIATVSSTEKNGWVRVSANGFHYSLSTIKLKLEAKPTKETAKKKP